MTMKAQRLDLEAVKGIKTAYPSLGMSVKIKPVGVHVLDMDNAQVASGDNMPVRVGAT